uniref:Ig-like domain-containing protein n=1 Tax=Esox lucius TaxID=8010 RepID=A0A6Q2WZD8_ESOLU
MRTERPQRSQPSNDLSISVSALPKATLLVKPNPVYPGETVTLTCSVGSYSDWRYKWHKDRNDTVVSQSGSSNPGASYTINKISVSDQGQYWCEGHRVSRPTSSQPSTDITLTVLALPMASVRISPHGLLYSGETVTLQCDISDYTDWTYWWYRNKQLLSPGSPSKTITTLSDQVSQYQCQGRRTDRPQSSQRSVSLHISVTGNRPKATMSSDKKDILIGDRVALTCTVESSGWRFYWYRHRQDSEPVATTSGSSYTLSQVSVSDGGQYRCRAGRGDPVYYTQYSESVHIQVTAMTKATLTVKPNPVYPGETVILTCSVGSYIDWRYKWYKDSKDTVVSQSERHTVTGDTLTMSRASESDQGLYWCQGERDSRLKSTSSSQPVSITVNGESNLVGPPL